VIASRARSDPIPLPLGTIPAPQVVTHSESTASSPPENAHRIGRWLKRGKIPKMIQLDALTGFELLDEERETHETAI